MSQRSANYKRQGQKGMKCLGLTPWNVASIKENHLSVKCLKRYFRYSTRTDMVNDTQYRLHSVPKSNYLKNEVHCELGPDMAWVYSLNSE